MRVDSLRLNVDPEEEMKIRFKPEGTPVTLAAKNSGFGRIYMNWARYPIAEIEPLELGERGYIVRLEDLRFDRTDRIHYFPSAIIRLNHDLSVTNVNFEDERYEALHLSRTINPRRLTR
jgi:hypothetical protein